MCEYIKYNANPTGKQVGDCTIRAISTALGETWDATYIGVAFYGYLYADMPSANHVWGAYLKSKGFRRSLIATECPDTYNVRDFCRDHPRGTYILAIDGHVVAVMDGDYYDTWDSGDEIPIYYWKRTEDNDEL